MDVDEYWCLRARVSASGGSVQGHVTSVDLGGNERRSVGGGTSQRAVPVPSRFSDSPSVGSCRDSLHGSMEDVGGVRVVTAATDRKQRLRDKRVIVRMLTAIVLLFAVSWFPFFTGQVGRHIYLLTYLLICGKRLDRSRRVKYS